MYYGVGDHDAGFVGFRVARTIGTNEDYRQEYFSLNQYSYALAHRLAHELDDCWAAEAEAVKRENKTERMRRHAGPHIIAQGLRAYIGVESKRRGGVKRTYFTPTFLVKQPGQGNPDLVFRITTHGYAAAFEKAVDRYCEFHDLADRQYKELLERIPSPAVFTGYLLNGLRNRGHQVSASEIANKLQSLGVAS